MRFNTIENNISSSDEEEKEFEIDTSESYLPIRRRLPTQDLLFSNFGNENSIQIESAEENKGTQSFIADWVRLGQQAANEGIMRNDYLSSDSFSEPSLDFYNNDLVPQKNKIIELRDVDSASLK